MLPLPIPVDSETLTLVCKVLEVRVRVPGMGRVQIPLRLIYKTRGREDSEVCVIMGTVLVLPLPVVSVVVAVPALVSPPDIMAQQPPHWHHTTSQCSHGGREVLGRALVEIRSDSCLSGAVEVRIGRGMQCKALLPLWWTQIAGVGRQA